MNIVNEEWRDISGYEGYYQVSNLGRVRSCDRVVKTERGDRAIKMRLMKPNLHRRGYYRIDLQKASVRITCFVHRLVAIAFLPIQDGRDQVNHKNGIKTDNCVDNLEWCNQHENMRHAVEYGLKPSMVGENAVNSLLTESQVLEIRELRANGTKLRIIAEMYGVSLSAIAMVVYCYNWAHLPSAVPEKRHSSCLEEAQVLEIRRLRLEGLKFKEIAKMFGVSQGAITGVVYRHTWKHI
jgi:transposase